MKIIAILEGNPVSAMGGVLQSLGQNMGEVICDALHCYASHPEDWAYPGELDEILVLIRACADLGLDYTKDAFNVAKNPLLERVCRELGEVSAKLAEMKEG